MDEKKTKTPKQTDKKKNDNRKKTPPPKRPQFLPENQGGNFQMKNLIIWALIIVLAISLARYVSSASEPKSVTFNEYQRLVQSNSVSEAEIVGRKFIGTLTREEIDQVGNMKQTYSRFSTDLPYVDRQMVEEWEESGITVKFSDPNLAIGDYIFQFAPWILFIGIWIFLMRRMQGGGGGSGIFGFGKSRARMISPDNPKVTFKDVAGCDEAKSELKEVVEFLRTPKKFNKLGAKIPRGALLLGSPGTGKTLLAKAVSGEAKVPFFTISGAEFVEMFVGVGASRVRDLFDQAKKNAPAIIFIDEIDAVGRHRGAGLGGGHDEREQTLNQILVEMDGFGTEDNVILIAATNRPDVLDKALLRPGRFDRQIVVDSPDIEGREAILKIHSKGKPVARGVNLRKIAQGTPGFVGADLENLINEAALLAARRNKKRIDNTDLDDAKDKVMMGTERRSMILTEEDRRITAFHEAGHAIVAYYATNSDPVHKVSIIPRGRALGITAQLPDNDRHNYSRSYLLSKLDILMGGRCAEQIIFGETTTGAANDIQTATEIAGKMIGEWGMNKASGPLTFKEKNHDVFLGKEISQKSGFSEHTNQSVDREIIQLVKAAEKNANKILKSKLEMLKKVSDVLLEKETITGDDLANLLEGRSMKRGRSRGRKKSKDTSTSPIIKVPKVESNKSTEEVPQPATIPIDDEEIPKRPRRKRRPRNKPAAENSETLRKSKSDSHPSEAKNSGKGVDSSGNVQNKIPPKQRHTHRKTEHNQSVESKNVSEPHGKGGENKSEKPSRKASNSIHQGTKTAVGQNEKTEQIAKSNSSSNFKDSNKDKKPVPEASKNDVQVSHPKGGNPREKGGNPREKGSNPREKGGNPREKGGNPRAKDKAEDLENNTE